MKTCIAAIVTTAVFLLTAGAASAGPITLTFDTDSSGPSYTEAGMTITSTAASTSQVEVAFGRWDVPCCPDPQFDQYELTTGGIFNLLSIDVWHSDLGDPIVFEGYLGAVLVSSFTINQTIWSTLTTFDLPGFTGLDKVVMTVSGPEFPGGPGGYTDPTFDNLKYSVPEPGILLLLGVGLVMVRFARRR